MGRNYPPNIFRVFAAMIWQLDKSFSFSSFLNLNSLCCAGMILILTQIQHGGRKYLSVGLPCERIVTKPICKETHIYIQTGLPIEVPQVLKKGNYCEKNNCSLKSASIGYSVSDLHWYMKLMLFWIAYTYLVSSISLMSSNRSQAVLAGSIHKYGLLMYQKNFWVTVVSPSSLISG